MNASLILEKLNMLNEVIYFIRFLEIRFVSDAILSQKLSIARQSLDQALIQLTFDLQKKIDNTPTDLVMIKISNEITNAFEQINEIGDQFLNKCFQDLLLFTKDYENNLSQAISIENDQNLKDLKDKILLITSERFG